MSTNGQLGLGIIGNRNTPTIVTDLPDVAAVNLGMLHSAVITTSGELFAWGNNAWDQLGLGANAGMSRNIPARVAGDDYIAVGLGQNHSAALTRSGIFYAWGQNNTGQLGIGSTVGTNTPTAVTGISGGVRVLRAAGAAVSGAPTVSTETPPTHNNITVNAVTIPTNPGNQNVEYAISTSTAVPAVGWQAETIFTGLTPNTMYYVFARSAANVTHNAGEALMSTAITTAESGNMPTATPSPSPTATPNPTPTPAPSRLRGDVNGDGRVDIEDILMVLDHIFEVRLLTGENLAAADVNNDRSVDIEDVLLILDHIFEVRLLH
jgi:hypothetical protein